MKHFLQRHLQWPMHYLQVLSRATDGLAGKVAAIALFCDKHHVRLMNDRNLFMNVLNASKLPIVNSAWCAAWKSGNLILMNYFYDCIKLYPQCLTSQALCPGQCLVHSP